MGLFARLIKKNTGTSDDAVVEMADGEIIDITTVSDPVFAQKMMGESIAFRYEGDTVTICAPAGGTLSVMFPTGHAFGITMGNGTELLVHIGINTVDANGTGFRVFKKQGDAVKAGEPVVEADLKLLSKNYDMSTMLIVTNANGKNIQCVSPQKIAKGESVITIH